MKKLDLKRLVIISDFDWTLTQKIVDGKFVPSLISILRDNNVLDEDYSQKAKTLFEKYHKIEKNPNVSEQEKYKAMETWWKEHYQLLKEKWLTLEHIKEAVNHPNIKLKKWVDKLFQFVLQTKVPFIIFSSSWLGSISIRLTLEKFNLPISSNIKIVSNELNFDLQGRFVGVDRIIHSMNKRLKDILQIDVNLKNLLKWKDQYLLLWDSLNDVKMIEGFKWADGLKIWFFMDDKDHPNVVEIWKQTYDILIPQEQNSIEKVLEILDLN